MTKDPPFFILGAPRSGTTLLRDILRLHPDLECPEETFFYRWSDTYASNNFLHIYRNNPTIQEHRRIDGVTDEVFEELLSTCPTRAALQEQYALAFLRVKGKPEARWFDKTPQNTNNLFRILDDFPKATVVHIHRNPLDSIGSLMQGRQFRPLSFEAAFNIWFEAVQSACCASRQFPGRVITVALAELIADPQEVIGGLSFELGIPGAPEIPDGMVKAAPHRFEQLSDGQIEVVIRLGRPFLEQLGYPTRLEEYRKMLASQ